MKILSLAITLILVTGLYSLPLKAQGLNPYFETLAEYNRIKPMQNPQWERSRDTLKSDILDRKNKTLGEVHDIVVTPNGTIQFLDAELDRIQLGEVALNYRKLNIGASERSYKLGYDDDQIKEVFADLLADIETAAGDDSDMISIDKLVGSDVHSDDGRRIGKIEEVMFTNSGDRAEALIVRVNYKTVRGESVAIPFSSADYKGDGSRYDVMLADDQTDTLLEFADKL